MGNADSLVYPEIRALTQLVRSFIQKRSTLHYQINQLKLAQNTKKNLYRNKETPRSQSEKFQPRHHRNKKIRKLL